MREAEVIRKTNETDIKANFVLDGSGSSRIDTGIGFFDHMLDLFNKHGLFDLSLVVRGDLKVDAHHSVEDTGIVLGQAVSKALGDKSGIKRYGTAFVPMDEALAMVSIDVSGRPYLNYGIAIPYEPLGGFDTTLTEEFLRAFCLHGGLTIHVQLLAGKNAHHITEAVFKALGRALAEAVNQDSRITGVLSTKGIL